MRSDFSRSGSCSARGLLWDAPVAKMPIRPTGTRANQFAFDAASVADRDPRWIEAQAAGVAASVRARVPG
jgi:hypothetical protein